MARNLVSMGFEQVGLKQSADICLINTCAVTQHAEKKCRQVIRKIANENKKTFIVLTGCHAHLQSDFLQQLPEVSMVEDKTTIVTRIADHFGSPDLLHKEINKTDFFSAYSLGGRTRSFLKVQDGCDYYCAYCTVPLARGASRNIAIADVVLQANAIAAAGAKEIILTGVNIGDFGKTTKQNFLQLIEQLDKVTGIERYRISSIEPNLLTGETIDFVANSSKFLPHFHIPLQAANDRVLALMKRRYTTEFFSRKIAGIQNKMSWAFIGIDVIAGFPTETEEEFLSGVDFLKKLKVAYLHVFPYSQRPGTAAFALPQTPQNIITMRANILGDLCKKLHRNFYTQHVGKTAMVLFESNNKNGKMTGFSENYIKVEMPYDARHINRIVKVKLSAVAGNGNMIGDLQTH
jgi:threonylcarbamoyladenosine tRNA methylthiotransferase MtaB